MTDTAPREAKPAMEAYADIAKERIAELRELLKQAEGPPMFRPSDPDQ